MTIMTSEITLHQEMTVEPLMRMGSVWKTVCSSRSGMRWY